MVGEAGEGLQHQPAYRFWRGRRTGRIVQDVLLSPREKSTRSKAMPSHSALIALGLVTLLLGGLVGGAIGALFARPVAADPQHAISPPMGARSADPALLHAIEELTQEVRRLGTIRTGEAKRR